MLTKRRLTCTTQWTPNSTLLLNGLCRCIYKTWMEGTYGFFYLPNKNPNFFCDYWTKSDEIFAEMQIISYICHNPKAYIKHSSQFRKLLINAESPIIFFFFFFFWGGGTICILASPNLLTAILAVVIHVTRSIQATTITWIHLEAYKTVDIMKCCYSRLFSHIFLLFYCLENVLVIIDQNFVLFINAHLHRICLF